METFTTYATGLTNIVNVPGSTRKFVYVNGVLVVPTATNFSSVTLASTPARGVPIQVNYDSPLASQDVLISGNLTIDVYNVAQYNGKTLAFTGAFTITLSNTLPADVGFAVLPPATGAATIAFGAGVTGNGASTSLTRALAANAVFAVIGDRRASNSYVVTGS